MPILGESDPFIRPYIAFVARGARGAEQTIRVRLDTGFDGSLALPPSLVDALGLQAATARRTQLADGSFAYFMEYRVRILWEGFERPVRALAKPGEPLAGIGLFEGYRVCIEFIDGGEIRAEFIA